MNRLKREGKPRAESFPAEIGDEKHSRGSLLKGAWRLLG